MLEGWPGEALLVKIWETLDKGGSGILRPWQIKREAHARAEARREELLMLAQAEIDVERIRKGKVSLSKEGVLLPMPKSEGKQVEYRPIAARRDESESPLFVIARQQRAAKETLEMRRAINIRKIAVFAEETVEDSTNDEVSEEPVDNDWFARWRDNAQDVSDEQMQRLWARVLAGEAKCPTSFSLHALHMLSRMSKADAELLVKIRNLIIHDAIIKTRDDYFSQVGLPFDKFLYLNDVGVLNGVTGIRKMYDTTEYQDHGIPKRRLILPIPPFGLVLSSSNLGLRTANFPVYTVSQPALQLLQLASPNADTDYIREVALVAKNTGFESASYGPLITKSDGSTAVNPDKLIDLKI